uniref:DUF4216 domain-containing protein n=1 Tax=Ananas comosus var. bracteatus TaxID=296719 RepID=A0A6V7QLV8_ANACO|nr:unnamed protein product [Ananas comosus var. bracteatus]
MEHMLSLARGLTTYVTCYNGYLINGYRFQIEDRDKGFKTQNCGVVVVGDTSAETEKQDYYGVLTEVIELQYVGGHRVVLFRCNWYDVYDREKGIKTDEYGIVSVNRQRLLKTNEPFVLANQASQVFYATDNINKGWHVVQKTQPRDLYEMPLQMDAAFEDVQDGIDAYQEYESFPSINNLSTSLNMDNEISRNRNDIEPMMVDADVAAKITKRNDSSSREDKLTFIPPGALGKGRAQFGLRSFYSLRPSTSQSILSLWKKHILEKNQGKLKRNVRGRNKCKEVAKLKSEKKLKVKFYNKRVVEKNHRVFSRHLERIVRDHNIYPLCVHSWKEIGDKEKEHMWAVVTVASKRNSSNRAKLTMPHRTGSELIRQGGKVGQPPSLATIFFETRKKGDKLVGEDTSKLYDKIVDATQSEPFLSNIELVEKCFGPQRHNHIICHGGGLKPNDMKTIGTRVELQAKLRETQKENDLLKSRMDEMEAEIRMIKEIFQRQHSNGPPPSSSEG